MSGSAGRLLWNVQSPGLNLQDPGEDVVVGGASFYVPDNAQVKIYPGTLDLKFLYGGGSGMGNFSTVNRQVEFYFSENQTNIGANFVNLNGNAGEYFTFTYFGKKS